MGQVGSGFGIGGIDLQLASLAEAYASHSLEARDVINAAHERTASFESKSIWAHLAPRDHLLRQLEQAENRLVQGQSLPLLGVPFAVADNIDVKGLPTTRGHAGHQTPTTNAPNVERLLQLGAICLGKTNVGNREAALTGLSSSFESEALAVAAGAVATETAGTALAVARGLVSFALATDGVGETLAPAALNGVIALRLTQGLASSRGTTMGAPSLESLAVLAGNACDAYTVLAAIHRFDELDPYARAVTGARARHLPPTIGVPTKNSLMCGADAVGMHRFDSICRKADELKWSIIEVDLEPFINASAEAVSGIVLAEYEASLTTPSNSAPKGRQERNGKLALSAAEVFRFRHHQRTLQHALSKLWQGMDALLVPTVSTALRWDEHQSGAQRVDRVGCYSAMPGLFDLSAVSLPAGLTSPDDYWGVTLLGPAWEEGTILGLASELHESLQLKVGATRVLVRRNAQPVNDTVNGVGKSQAAVPLMTNADSSFVESFVNLGDTRQVSGMRQSHQVDDSAVQLAVVGTHLQGEVDHHQLVELNAQFIRTTRTASRYELFTFTDRGSEQPALVRRSQPSGSVRVEVYRLQAADFGKLVARVTSSQSVGEIELDDGTWVKGFLCPPGALAGARDITKFGGWIEYRRARAQATSLRSALAPAERVSP